MLKQSLTGIMLSLMFALLGSHAIAATPQYELTIAEHRFTPAEIVIPANTRVRLIVHNKDNSPEEFHSDSLHREKIIGPNMTGKINIGPLAPGVYTFMGEFHARTAQGQVVVK